MSRQVLNRFLKALRKNTTVPVDIFLTGGMASLLLGGARPTRDVDFAFKIRGKRTPNKIKNLEDFLQTVAQYTQIPLEYSEDIDRWSMIHLGGFEKNALPYHKFGKCHVKILHPLPWSVGKLSRYYDSDCKDLIQVLKQQRLPWKSCVSYWFKCLLKSPPSSHQFLFRKNVNHFLQTHGKKIWGKTFPEKEASQFFKKLIH